MALGLALLCVAGVGFGLGVLGDRIALRWLSYVAFVIVALSVLGGWVVVIRGWMMFSRKRSRLVE